MLGSSGGGVDKNQLELVLPVVELSVDADDLEWVGQQTFDFTKYEMCIAILNAKRNTEHQLYGYVDGKTTGYYHRWTKRLHGGGTSGFEDNDSLWNIDPNSYMSGGDADVFGVLEIIKNKVTSRIHLKYFFEMTTGWIEGVLEVQSATKLDKLRIRSYRNGFGDLFTPWKAGSTLTVYGWKKS